MEKPGMGGRTILLRAGLLRARRGPGFRAGPPPLARRFFFLFLLRAALLSPLLFSQTAPTVMWENPPASVTAGLFWTLTLLVDHPSPEEVEVRLPPLPQGLNLDGIRSGPRLLQNPPEGAGRRWTSLQYRFLAGSPGRITLGPFEVRVGEISVMSSALSLTVRNPSPQPPRLYWRDLPRTLVMGEEYTLVLCIEGRNRPDPPAAGLSLPPVPPMTIMEALAPEGDDELLSFRLIPLEGPFFTFPSFPFPLETQTFPVPALRIPVNPAPAAPAEEPESAPLPELPEETPVPERVSPPFPSPPPEGPGFSRRLQERIRSLWEAGQIVEALAELRRNERDHPAGFTLVGYRRALEQALGLEEEPAERYAPPILLVPALVLCLLLAALSFTLPAALAWVPLRVFRWAGFFFGVVALLCLLRLGLGYHLSVSYGGRPPRRALAREAVVYRVPDDRGTEIARLKEGQGLLVYEVRDGWAYAESLVNGRTGWIRTGTYLIY